MGDTNADTNEETDGVHRLLGMVVQEVSLVDRAANQRQFLVVKRNPMTTTKTTKDANAEQPAMPGGSAPSAAKLPAMQAQVKDSLLAAVVGAAQKLSDLATQIKDAETTDQQVDPPVPETVTGTLGEIATMISSLQAQYGAGAKAAKPAGAAPPAGQAGAAAAPAKADLDGVTANGGADEQGEQKRDVDALGKMADLLKGLVPSAGISLDLAKAANDVVIKAADVPLVLAGLAATQRITLRKVGKKMAKERLERYRKAMDLLAGIYKELSLDTNGGGRKRVGKAADGPVLAKGSIVLKVAEARGLVTVAEQLTAELKKRDDAIKALRAEVVTLKRAPQASQALTPEGGAARGGKAVSWPLDMNRDTTSPSTPVNFAAGRR